VEHSHPGISLIGCGRVGCTVALGLQNAGYQVLSVSDVNSNAERRARRLLKLPTEDRSSSAGDLVLIGTPDSQIESAYRLVARQLMPGQTVVHFSGLLPSSIFNSAPAAGGVLALHPVMTFPTFPSALTHRRAIPAGCWFALEGNRKGIAVGKRLVPALGGRAFVIRAEQKPLFHAACAFASNFTNVVLDAAMRLAVDAGLPPRRAWRVLKPLVEATLENLGKAGPVMALTGPVERGDVETIRRHLAALRRSESGLVPLYQALSRHALEMAQKKHRLSTAQVRAMKKILSSQCTD